MSDIELHQTTIPAYPKIWALGHPSVTEIFYDHIVAQEKVDGSQFSFGIINGTLMIRSKGQMIYQEAPPGMFKKGVEYVQTIQDRLVPGWIYRSEYLEKPKHNALAYNRVPKNHIALYDILVGSEKYMARETIEGQAERLDIDFVPTFFEGIMSAADIQNMMQTESFLGGQTIEGVVIKNYHRFCQKTGHTLMGKYVSEAYKEVHSKAWKEDNPSGKDVVQQIIEDYKTPARWEKAVYRLRDAGQLENDPRDIGKLIREVWPDIVAECEDEIKDRLWKHFKKQIGRAVVAGLPEWYKKRLLDQQFTQEA